VKVLHVTYSYAPDPMGGTEIYVGDLCRRLEARGIRAVIAAPGHQTSPSEIDGVLVRRFPFAARSDELETLYGAGDPVASDAFDAVLDAERPDLVHQHALSPACSAELVARARRRGMPVVFTYHTPAVSCQRGTLLRWGTEVCDGRLDVRQCTACTLQSFGLNRTVSRMLASAPEAVGEAVAHAGLSGGGWTALRLSTLMRRRHEGIASVLSLVDRVIVPAGWVREVLRANGVPDGRIVQAPHGVARVAASEKTAWDAKYLRLAYFGRLDAHKGTDLLVTALGALPDAPITLDVFGIAQSEADRHALGRLRDLAGGDHRIRFLHPLDHASVTTHLSTFDAVVVPSQLLETGPLVVLEAFAAGVPVIGSALGGIAEKVRHAVDGWLVSPYDSADAWRDALARCVGDRSLLARLRHGIVPPRSLDDAAAEMHELYKTVLADRRAAQTAPRDRSAVQAGQA
jgi:glycosyltransferase involved in cell wall biosynthesis